MDNNIFQKLDTEPEIDLEKRDRKVKKHERQCEKILLDLIDKSCPPEQKVKLNNYLQTKSEVSSKLLQQVKQKIENDLMSRRRDLEKQLKKTKKQEQKLKKQEQRANLEIKKAQDKAKQAIDKAERDSERARDTERQARRREAEARSKARANLNSSELDIQTNNPLKIIQTSLATLDNNKFISSLHKEKIGITIVETVISLKDNPEYKKKIKHALLKKFHTDKNKDVTDANVKKEINQFIQQLAEKLSS